MCLLHKKLVVFPSCAERLGGIQKGEKRGRRRVRAELAYERLSKMSGGEWPESKAQLTDISLLCRNKELDGCIPGCVPNDRKRRGRRRLSTFANVPPLFAPSLSPCRKFLGRDPAGARSSSTLEDTVGCRYQSGSASAKRQRLVRVLYRCRDRQFSSKLEVASSR